MSGKTGIQWTDATGRRLGRLKQLAQAAGISVEEYQKLRDRGQKWCMLCRAWQPESAFAIDRSRYDGLTSACRASRNSESRASYTPAPLPRRYGPLPQAGRDGDVRQARYKVNHEVAAGRIPPPNSLPCTDCGHRWQTGDPRHEYDHYLGYAAVHHLDVQPVCTRCHHQREADRRRAS